MHRRVRRRIRRRSLPARINPDAREVELCRMGGIRYVFFFPLASSTPLTLLVQQYADTTYMSAGLRS
jgi:hypothetical protein